jgi:steroid 5-alpha reductase family enzyme
MAFPALDSLQECADFSNTVEPFLPQLYDLPAQIATNILNPEKLLDLYVQTNPLISAFAIAVFLAVAFLLVSEITRNYSQVDRLWSLLPNFYVAHLAIWARLVGVPHQRLDLILVFTTIWSVRNDSHQSMKVD